MERRHRRRLLLVVAGLVLFALGFLTESCPLSSPGPPIVAWNATRTALSCTRPAFPLVLLFWLPAGVLVVLGAALDRHARKNGA